MRTLFFLIVCFLLTACNNNTGSHRPSYVISKSIETLETEDLTESPAE